MKYPKHISSKYPELQDIHAMADVKTLVKANAHFDVITYLNMRSEALLKDVLAYTAKHSNLFSRWVVELVGCEHKFPEWHPSLVHDELGVLLSNDDLTPCKYFAGHFNATPKQVRFYEWITTGYKHGRTPKLDWLSDVMLSVCEQGCLEDYEINMFNKLCHKHRGEAKRWFKYECVELPDFLAGKSKHVYLMKSHG